MWSKLVSIHLRSSIIMPKEMKDKDKGEKDRISELEKEQQKKMENMNVSEPGKYPESKGDTKKDVPPGT